VLYLALATPWYLICATSAAPLIAVSHPSASGEPQRANHATILKKTIDGANAQVKLMKLAVDGARHHSAPDIKKITDVFTASYNLEQISKMVDAFLKGTIYISAKVSPFRGAIASADPDKGELMLGELFYEQGTDEWMRVATILHEASQLFGRTLDFWEWNYDHTQLFPVPPELAREHAINGDMYLSYSDVKKYAPRYLHKNADTWGVFGFSLEHGKPPPPLQVQTKPSGWTLGVPCTRVAASSLGRSRPGLSLIIPSGPHNSPPHSHNTHAHIGAHPVSAHSAHNAISPSVAYSAGHSWADDMSLPGHSRTGSSASSPVEKKRRPASAMSYHPPSPVLPPEWDRRKSMQGGVPIGVV
jgi:hypothetical protein